MTTNTVLNNVIQQLKQLNNVSNISIQRFFSEDEGTICHKVVVQGYYFYEDTKLYFYSVIFPKDDKKNSYKIDITQDRYEALYMFKTFAF